MNKHLSFLITVLIALNCIGIGAIFYMYHTVEKKHAGVIEKGQEFSREVQKVQMLDTISATLNRTTEEGAALTNYFIDSENVVAFIEELEGLAKKQNLGMSVRTVDTPNKTVGERTYPIVQITFIVEGSWSNVMSFVYFVENLPYRLSIENSKFSSLTKDGTTTTWTGSFTVVGLLKTQTQ